MTASHSESPVPVVPRPRLDDLAARALGTRVTVLAAGPGFGKTTLLEDWDSRLRAARISLTDNDRSTKVLARRLGDVLRLRVPGVIPAIGLSTDGETGGDSASGHAAYLAEALERQLTRPLLLIIDDVHEVARSDGASLIESLVHQAPKHLPIVLSGRGEPPLKLARLRSRGEVLDIGPEDLAFTLFETRQLAEAILGADESARTAGQVFRTTGGWPAATRLAIEAVRDRSEGVARRLLAAAPEPGDLLFDYLAEEVISSLDQGDREFLHRLSALGPVPPELCLDLGLIDRPRLTTLMAAGVYIENTESGIAVRTPVSGVLATQDHVDIADPARLHEQATRWHLARHEYPGSLRHAVSAGVELTIEALHTGGDRAITAGGAREVHAASISVPPELRTDHINRLLGEALLAGGDWEGALDAFRLTTGTQDRIDPGLAWRMGLVLHLRGEVVEAIDTYRRGDLGSGSLEDRALLLSWWAGAVWLTGDIEETKRLSEEALAMSSQADSSRARAAALTVKALLAATEGDRRANELHYLSALEHAERAGDALQLIRIHVNRGSRHLEEGSYEEAIAETELALPLADLAGYTALRALGINNRGQALSQLGRFDEAIADFRRAQLLWQGLASRQVAYASVAIGDIHRLRGDLNLARLAYEEAIQVAEPVGDIQGLIPALAGLAAVIAVDEPERALEIATRADQAGPGLHRIRAILAQATAYLAMGQSEEAATAAGQALTYARGRRDPAGMAEALELLANAGEDPERNLVEAISIWEELGNPLGIARSRLRLAASTGVDETAALELRSSLRRLGARRLADEADRLIDEARRFARPEVTIFVLGGFQVKVDDGTVPGTAWQSKIARDIVKLLVARRGKPIHREALIDQFWPDEDPARASGRLSVALSVIRRVLDPEKSHPPNQYLESEGGVVSLTLANVGVDLETFLHAAESGLSAARSGDRARALALLEKAEATYAGDAFEDEPYEEWASSVRDQAKETYLSVARWLAAQARRSSDHEGAGRYLLRIIQRDPYDESAHLELVGTLIEARRHGEARRLYQQYCSRMEELGIDPAPYA